MQNDNSKLKKENKRQLRLPVITKLHGCRDKNNDNGKHPIKAEIKKKKTGSSLDGPAFSELRRARTFDPRLKRALLYQLSY